MRLCTQVVSGLIVFSIILATGCKNKENQTPEDLIKSILSANSLEEYSEDCAVNADNAEEVLSVLISEGKKKRLRKDLESGEINENIAKNWRRSRKEMAQYGFSEKAVVEVTFIHNKGEPMKNIDGRLHENGKSCNFKLRRCVMLPEVGWRSNGDLNLSSR